MGINSGHLAGLQIEHSIWIIRDLGMSVTVGTLAVHLGLKGQGRQLIPVAWMQVFCIWNVVAMLKWHLFLLKTWVKLLERTMEEGRKARWMEMFWGLLSSLGTGIDCNLTLSVSNNWRKTFLSNVSRVILSSSYPQNIWILKTYCKPCGDFTAMVQIGCECKVGRRPLPSSFYTRKQCGLIGYLLRHVNPCDSLPCF